MTRRKQMLDDLEQDIREHIEQEVEDNIGRGMSPEAARTAAMRKFGNVMLVKEDTRAVWAPVWLEQLVQDLRFGLRLLRKNPGFTIAAVLTLALAIGANSVVFATINAFVLHPLDLPQVDTLYTLERGHDKNGSESYPDYKDLRDRNHSFDGLAAYDVNAISIDTGSGPTRVWSLAATGNYFDVLRLKPFLGRFFHAGDELGPNSAPYIVLGYSYWHTRFKDDRGVIGRVVQVNKHPYTIVGVAPHGFSGTLMFFHPDVYTPMVNMEQLYGESQLEKRGSHWMFETFGHLKPGVTRAQAIADLNTIGADLSKTYPEDDGDMTFALARPGLYGDYLGPVIQGFLGGLMLLAGLVLLAACANLGSLFAARAAERSREVALRLAVGAGRMRILRQMFTESILISVMGGALGLWASVGLLNWLSAWNPFPQWPAGVPVHAGASVYLAALLLALASGFLFGAMPVRQALCVDPYEIVKSGARTTSDRRVTGRDVLLGAQIAICAVLVTSSLVAVRGLLRSLHSDFGFQPEHALVIDTDLTGAGYRGDALPAFRKRVIDELKMAPGVTAAAYVDVPPLATGSWNITAIYTDETTDLRPKNAAAEPVVMKVSPEYFHAAGTALLAGRDLTWHDDRSAPPVAVVNREFARKIFGTTDGALGRYFKNHDGKRVQVVGVAEDGKYGSLTEDPQPAIYLSFLQSDGANLFVVRTDGDPQQVAPAARAKLRQLDAGMFVSIQTWSKAMEPTLFGARMAAISLGVLGVMAAMLSITGIFGMAAYSISKRMKELGIRIALGAQPRELLQAALGRALKLLAWGSAAGLVLGILASRVLAAIVYEATPRDPLVLSGVVLAMAMLGLLATWIPAQRALSIDPLVLLREE